MPIPLQWLLISIGLIAAVGLAWMIRGQLRESPSAPQTAPLSNDVHTNEQQHSAVASIDVLIRCVLANQMDVIEACIRIHHLLDHVNTALNEQADFRIFGEIVAATAHMPTHQARRQTDEHFLQKLDKQRHVIEQQHFAAIRSACERLQGTLNDYR